MTWEPVLDGPLADAAWRKVRDIVRDVATRSGSPVDRTLFWAYASHALDEPSATASYDAAIEDLIALCASTQQMMLYDDGLAGVGWVLAHVLDADDDGVLATIDETLLHLVSHAPWRGDYELARGLAGCGVYFLERLRAGPVPRARDGLARVVAHLAATAECDADGARWFTRYALQSVHQRQRFPYGRYDL